MPNTPIRPSRDSSLHDTARTSASHSAIASHAQFSPSSPTHSVSGYSERSHPVSSYTTMDTQPTQESEEAPSCDYDPDVWFQNFREDEEEINDDSHILPTEEQLEKAANLPVYDADGVSRTFKSLFTGSEHVGQRQLIIFIRHFYCFGCSTYLQKLTETITPSAYFSLPVPTTITVIGCGMPHLIPRYTTQNSCPFRIYADPSTKLYKALGMHKTLQYGIRPQYMSNNSAWEMTVKSLMPSVKAKRKDKLAGGHLLQVGGEFLFEDGEPIWCRRMHTMRDHTEMAVIRKILEMDDEVPVVQEATAAVAVRPQQQQQQQQQQVQPPLSSGSNSSSNMPFGGPLSSHPVDSGRASSIGVKESMQAGGAAARGLKLVWDGTGVQAHLSRESRIPEEGEDELDALREVQSYYGASELSFRMDRE